MSKEERERAGPGRSGAKRAALHTLGCRLNQAEGEAMRRGLEAGGWSIVAWEEEADLYVLNSCTVTSRADAKSRQALRSARRRSPRARLALVGCYAQVWGEGPEMAGIADIVIGNRDKLRLAEILREENGAGPIIRRSQPSRAPFEQPPLFDLRGPTRAGLKIQDGCDFMCSFCIIPAARGRSRPRKLDNLLEEAEAMAEAGAREIVLTGVNLGVFDHGGAGLSEVIDRLDAIAGVSRIRISSIEPTTVEEGLLERMADRAHALAPYLHLPLQSGSDTILAAMGRRYGAGEYRSFAEKALDTVPGLCLGSDVMVGFPGEDEAAWLESRGLLEELPFAYFHIFPYSRRRGTPAVRLPGRVLPEVIRRRAAELAELSRAKRLAFHRGHEGRVLEVLFERPGGNAPARGYTENYIPVEVDVPAPHRLRNRLERVRLLESSAEGMAGELLSGQPG